MSYLGGKLKYGLEALKSFKMSMGELSDDDPDVQHAFKLIVRKFERKHIDKKPTKKQLEGMMKRAINKAYSIKYKASKGGAVKIKHSPLPKNLEKIPYFQRFPETFSLSQTKLLPHIASAHRQAYATEPYYPTGETSHERELRRLLTKLPQVGESTTDRRIRELREIIEDKQRGTTEQENRDITAFIGDIEGRRVQYPRGFRRNDLTGEIFHNQRRFLGDPEEEGEDVGDIMMAAQRGRRMMAAQRGRLSRQSSRSVSRVRRAPSILSEGEYRPLSRGMSSRSVSEDARMRTPSRSTSTSTRGEYYSPIDALFNRSGDDFTTSGETISPLSSFPSTSTDLTYRTNKQYPRSRSSSTHMSFSQARGRSRTRRLPLNVSGIMSVENLRIPAHIPSPRVVRVPSRRLKK